MIFAKGKYHLLRCLKQSHSTAYTNSHTSPQFSQGSLAGTPISSSQTSLTYNLTDAYTLAVQTNSFREMWSKLHQSTYSNERIDIELVDQPAEPELLDQLIFPSHDYVSEALSQIRSSALTKLVSTYFDHSESTFRLCLYIHQSVHRARLIYKPLAEFLDVLPLDLENETLSLSQIQCAFDIFLQFYQFNNPFPSRGSYNFDDMRCCFSKLRLEIDQHLRESKIRIQGLCYASGTYAICLVAATVGLISKVSRRGFSLQLQLEDAAMGIFVLHNHLDTIDRLVARLHAGFEGDKLLIRLGLDRDGDRHPTLVAVKQIRKTHSNVLKQLSDLDEHLCRCFLDINRARSLLLNAVSKH